jgi:Domain of unknown function (DUF4399)
MTKRRLLIFLIIGLAFAIWQFQIRAPRSGDPDDPTPSSVGDLSKSPTAVAPTAPPLPPVSGLPRNSLPVAPPPAATAGAQLTLVSPRDGSTVISPVMVQAQLRGMRLARAGSEDANAGHLHVLIDSKVPTNDGPIARDARHIDFDEGVSSGEVELPAGKHTIQLLLGDSNHVPFRPHIASETVAITVRRSDRVANERP